MEAQADFSRFLLIFYESWTTPIACIHILYTLGNIYIEAFSFLLAIFVLAPFSPCTFSIPAPI